MTFAAKLREKKSKLKESSVATYLRNIRRLRKVKGALPIPPTDYKWLVSKSLLSWVDDQPLSVRRHMATAAVVALSVYEKESIPWKKRSKEAMIEFDKIRNRRELTTKQKKLIPAKGFSSLKKVVGQMKRELRHLLKGGITTLKQLLRVQDLVILSLYENYPLRLDYATMKVGESEEHNSVYKQRKKPAGWHLKLVDFKTVKSLGPKIFKVSAANNRLLNIFVPASEKLTTHGYLLTNSAGGKMSKQVLSKRLMKITKARIGSRFSVHLIRVLYAMANRGVLESSAVVSEKLMHSQKQSLQYAKKD